MNRPWPGFTAPWSHSVSALLAIGFLAAAVTLVLRRHSRTIAATSFMLGLPLPWVLFVHGAIVSVIGGAHAGVGWQVHAAGAIYMLAGACTGVLVKNTFSDGELLRLRALPEHAREPIFRRPAHAR